MPDILKELERVHQRLVEENLKFALAGGLACSVYRHKKRATDDLDFLIYSNSNTETAAKKFLQSLGYRIGEARVADIERGPMHAIQKKSTPICMLVGRKEGHIGLDLILPSMRCFDLSLERAQSNIIDFQKIKLPCLTPEDIILAKLYALYNDSTRFNDADDLKGLFTSSLELDFSYLVGQMKKYAMILPPLIEEFSPDILKKISKKNKKTKRTI